MVVPDPNRFILDWSARYVDRYYRPVGLVDIRSLQRTDYRWDEEAAQAKPARIHPHLGSSNASDDGELHRGE